jgi:hypothetical protein
MRQNTTIATLCLLFAWLGIKNAANAQSVDLRTTAPGAAISGSFRIANMAFVLPNGEWRLLARQDSQSTGGHAGIPVPMLTAYLADIRNGRLHRAVFVHANVQQNPRADSGGRWTDEPCKRSDVLFKNDIKYSFFDINCTMLNHLVFARTTTNVLANEARKQLAALGASYPGTMIAAQFTRFNPRWFMQIWYYFNPEIDGFAPSRDSSWANNDWHKDLIDQDPRKVAYVEELKQWSTAMGPWIVAGFEGKLHAGSPGPEPFARSAAAPEKGGVPSTKPSTSARLAEVKELLDRGQITKDEYEQKRKQILDGL